MEVSGSGRPGESVALLPAASIALRYNGAMLVRRSTHRERPLSLGELDLLQRLAAGPVDPAVVVDSLVSAGRLSGEEAQEAMADLDARRLLQWGVGGAVRPFGERPWAPAVPVGRPAADDLLSLATPTVVRPTADGFVVLDLDGRRIAVLQPEEVLATQAFASATTLSHAHELVEAQGSGLDTAALDALVDRLLARGLLRHAANDGTGERLERSQSSMRSAVGHAMRLRRAVNRSLAELDAQEKRIERQTGIRRIPVVPIHHQGQYMPLGLGMILSYLRSHTDGAVAQHFQVRPDWTAADRPIEELATQPAVYLFSNYLWSHKRNLDRSRAIKDASPASLTIHGGPDTPKYEGDLQDYLERNPHVDVAVHGEGEVATTEILEALAGTLGGPGPIDLSPLMDVTGISFRLGGEVVRTPERERLADLNVIPSPFLTGVFDAYRGLPNLNVVLETNRGCPYGCTFCDWGTATMARIRKFDIDRVMGELEWCATAGAQGIALADANFGIFERDVDIAARVVELKRQHGFPLACSGSYAKNTVKHLEQIIGMWVDSGMLTLGVLSLQTMDPATLDAVRRSNIKTEKYDLLARQFRERNLPLYVDLMMALPGATRASFIDDLQSCIDREVQAKIHETVLLPNSPMNEPAYRAEHGIQIRRAGSPGSEERSPVVVATASMSAEDLEFIQRLRPVYLFGENFGVLRHVARYLRHETGTREVELYLRILDRAVEAPERWPAFDFLVATMPHFMAPPVSWSLLLEEVRELLVDDFGVADDDALRSVLDVQRAVVPSLGRPERITLELAHDYARWHEMMMTAKLEDIDWTSLVPPLRELPPATFTADDPLGLSGQMLGTVLDTAWFDSWELVSPVARPSVLGSGLMRSSAAEAVPS